MRPSPHDVRRAPAGREDIVMTSDQDLERDVKAALRWNPDINADDIAVAVRDGVVTLSGFVRSYGQKWEAERVVKRVKGVRGVANDIEVRLPIIHRRPDPDIARDAVAASEAELPYSWQHIRVTVVDGRVTLEGQVEWNYVRERAAAAVRRVRGVKGISNRIEVSPRAEPHDLKRKIEEAFRRNAELDANRISVEAEGGIVTLKGTVRTW